MNTNEVTKLQDVFSIDKFIESLTERGHFTKEEAEHFAAVWVSAKYDHHAAYAVLGRTRNIDWDDIEQAHLAARKGHVKVRLSADTYVNGVDCGGVMRELEQHYGPLLIARVIWAISLFSSVDEALGHAFEWHEITDADTQAEIRNIVKANVL